MEWSSAHVILDGVGLGGVDLKGIPTGDTLMHVKKTYSFA